MTEQLATLERTEDGGLIRFERLFPNGIGDVWSALTDPRSVSGLVAALRHQCSC
jgi:uncharacterized protein YndB with AHSA1/START domain